MRCRAGYRLSTHGGRSQAGRPPRGEFPTAFCYGHAIGRGFVVSSVTNGLMSPKLGYTPSPLISPLRGSEERRVGKECS